MADTVSVFGVGGVDVPGPEPVEPAAPEALPPSAAAVPVEGEDVVVCVCCRVGAGELDELGEDPAALPVAADPLLPDPEAPDAPLLDPPEAPDAPLLDPPARVSTDPCLVNAKPVVTSPVLL